MSQYDEESGRLSPRTGLNMLGGTIAIFVAEALILPTGFITAIFLARRLGPVGYGMFALASTVIVFTEWGCTAIFSSTTVKFISEAGDDWGPVATTVSRLYVLAGITMAVVLLFLAGPLALLFAEPAMAGYLRLFAIDVPIVSLSSANISILLGRGCFRKRALISASRWITRLILIILFVELGFSVSGAIMGSIGASVIELIISSLYVRLRFFSRSSFPVRKLWGFAVPLFMNSLCIRLLKLDLFALKALGATGAEVGFYSAATNLSIPPSLLSASLSPPLLSTLSGLLDEGRDQRAIEIGRTAIRSVFWLLPFAAMTAGASSEIVNFIFGQTFLPAGPMLSLLIFATVGLHATGVANALLTASNRPGLILVLTVPAVFLAFVGYLFVIPARGGIGAASVLAAGACFIGFGSILIACRIWGTRWPYGDFFKCILCSLFAYGMALLWPVSGWVVVVKIIAIVVAILVAFLSLGLFTSHERALLRSLLSMRFRENRIG